MTLYTLLLALGWFAVFVATIAIIEVLALVVDDLRRGAAEIERMREANHRIRARIEAELGRRGDS